MPDVRFPEIEVQLSGTDGNGFAVLGRVTSALKREKVPHVLVERFIGEATAGDYDHLLQTCMKWVSIS
jgi:hypothetical protein